MSHQEMNNVQIHNHQKQLNSDANSNNKKRNQVSSEDEYRKAIINHILL